MRHIGALPHRIETKNLSKLGLITGNARLATASETATCNIELRNGVIASLESRLLTELKENAATEHDLFLTQEALGIDDSYHSTANYRAISKGLRDGLFTIFSSAYAPFLCEDPTVEKLSDDEVAFGYIPNGIPGMQTRMALLYYEGVPGGRITVNLFVGLNATDSANAYGLHLPKDTIAVGSVADVVIWNEKDAPIPNAMLHHEVNYTQEEDMAIKLGPPPLFLTSKSIGTAQISADLKARRGSLNTPRPF